MITNSIDPIAVKCGSLLRNFIALHFKRDAQRNPLSKLFYASFKSCNEDTKTNVKSAIAYVKVHGSVSLVS